MTTTKNAKATPTSVRYIEPWDTSKTIVSQRTVIERNADGSVVVSYAGTLETVPASCIIEFV